MCKHFVYFVMLSLTIIEAESYGAGYMTHFRTYLLHDDKRIIRYLGTLKKGGNYVNRAIGSFKPGIIPMCHIHRH
jgi:hypothetical protein